MGSGEEARRLIIEPEIPSANLDLGFLKLKRRSESSINKTEIGEVGSQGEARKNQEHSPFLMEELRHRVTRRGECGRMLGRVRDAHAEREIDRERERER